MVSKDKGETWVTQAKDHEGHTRTVIDHAGTTKVYKCSCGESWTEESSDEAS